MLHGTLKCQRGCEPTASGINCEPTQETGGLKSGNSQAEGRGVLHHNDFRCSPSDGVPAAVQMQFQPIALASWTLWSTILNHRLLPRRHWGVRTWLVLREQNRICNVSGKRLYAWHWRCAAV